MLRGSSPEQRLQRQQAAGGEREGRDRGRRQRAGRQDDDREHAAGEQHETPRRAAAGAWSVRRSVPRAGGGASGTAPIAAPKRGPSVKTSAERGEPQPRTDHAPATAP